MGAAGACAPVIHADAGFGRAWRASNQSFFRGEGDDADDRKMVGGVSAIDIIMIDVCVVDLLLRRRVDVGEDIRRRAGDGQRTGLAVDGLA